MGLTMSFPEQSDGNLRRLRHARCARVRRVFSVHCVLWSHAVDLQFPIHSPVLCGSRFAFRVLRFSTSRTSYYSVFKNRIHIPNSFTIHHLPISGSPGCLSSSSRYAYRHGFMRFAFCVSRFAFCVLRFAFCGLRFAFCVLRFAVCVLRFMFCIKRIFP